MWNEDNNTIPKPSGGMEPIPDNERRDRTCRHPGHKPPTMIHIPAGMQYRHICPGCGNVVILRSSQATL